MVFSGGLSTRESDVLDSDGSDEVDTKLFRPLGYWAYVKPELYDVKHDRAFVWRTCALRMGRYNDIECS